MNDTDSKTAVFADFKMLFLSVAGVMRANFLSCPICQKTQLRATMLVLLLKLQLANMSSNQQVLNKCQTKAWIVTIVCVNTLCDRH